MQTKLESFIEACINTIIGFTITIVCLPVVNWICDIEMNASQMGLSTFIFTIISVLRGYVIRRFFNNMYRLKYIIKKLLIKNYGKDNI
jgi:hypothetical protein